MARNDPFGMFFLDAENVSLCIFFVGGVFEHVRAPNDSTQPQLSKKQGIKNIYF